MDKKNTVKKIIIIAAIAVVVLTCALVLIFCSGHQHIPGKIEQEHISDATCSSRGSYQETTYCSKCNELMSKTIKYVDRLPHDLADGICTVCGFDASVPESTEGLSFIVSRDENGREIYHLQDIGTCLDVEEIVIGTYKGRPVTKLYFLKILIVRKNYRLEI